MKPPDEPAAAPDVDRLARSMLLLHGVHDDDHTGSDGPGRNAGSWAKAPGFSADTARATALHEATRRDRERYLNAGLASVDCRFCHVTVRVKKLGPAHTSVQWTSDASQRCAYFNELRDTGGDSARAKACPKLADSIRHAVTEGCLEEFSSEPSPGDG